MHWLSGARQDFSELNFVISTNNHCCCVSFISPYSPDMNPIELCFGYGKSWLRRHQDVCDKYPKRFFEIALHELIKPFAVPLLTSNTRFARNTALLEWFLFLNSLCLKKCHKQILYCINKITCTSVALLSPEKLLIYSTPPQPHPKCHQLPSPTKQWHYYNMPM